MVIRAGEIIEFGDFDNIQNAIVNKAESDLSNLSSNLTDAQKRTALGRLGFEVVDAAHVLWIVDPGSPDQLWKLPVPTDGTDPTPSSAALVGSFPSGLAQPFGITFAHDNLWIVDSGSPEQLWKLSAIPGIDPTTSDASLVGSFPDGLSQPFGITFAHDNLWIVDPGSPDELWRLTSFGPGEEPTPSDASLVGSFPSGLSQPFGITFAHNTLWIPDLGSPNQLWKLPIPTDGTDPTPSIASLVGNFPGGMVTPSGTAFAQDTLWIVDSGPPNQLWKLSLTSGTDPTPSSASLVGSFPSGLAQPFGITSSTEQTVSITLNNNTYILR